MLTRDPQNVNSGRQAGPYLLWYMPQPPGPHLRVRGLLERHDRPAQINDGSSDSVHTSRTSASVSLPSVWSSAPKTEVLSLPTDCPPAGRLSRFAHAT